MMFIRKTVLFTLYYKSNDLLKNDFNTKLDNLHNKYNDLNDDKIVNKNK